MMRYLLFCLACLPAMSMAQTPPDSFNQEKLEERFRAADKDGDGRLSREEAYAASARAPELFDEIDANKDNYVTLAEINQARARRIEAALNAGALGVDVVAGGKYIKPDYVKGNGALPGGEGDPTDLSSAIAQRRSTEFNEFLGDDNNAASDPGKPAAPPKYPLKLIDKSFNPL
mgnify:CR=1 FL=1